MTTVDLATLVGFDYKLEECLEYEIRFRPLVTSVAGDGEQWKGPEIIKPFTFIDKLHPPETINIFNITHSSFSVSWQPNKCSNTKEVELILSNRNGSIVTEYRPPSYKREHVFTMLQSCTDYLVQVLILETRESIEGPSCHTNANAFFITNIFRCSV